MPGEVIALAGIIFGNILFGVIVLAWWSMRKRRLELQAEVQTKLIERFGSTPELIEFLKSESGREFVTGVQKGAIVVTQERVLAGIRRAIILTFLGLGFVAMWVVFDEFFAVPAILFLSLGLGFLVATVVSAKLSRSYNVSDSTTVRYDPAGQQ